MDIRIERDWFISAMRGILSGYKTNREIDYLCICFDIDPGGFTPTLSAGNSAVAHDDEELYLSTLRSSWANFDRDIFNRDVQLITESGQEICFVQEGGERRHSSGRYGLTGGDLDRYEFEGEGDHFIQALGLMMISAVKALRDEGVFDAMFEVANDAYFEVREVHDYFQAPSNDCLALSRVRNGSRIS